MKTTTLIMMLASLPAVANVTVSGTMRQSTLTLIHFVDYHYVPKEHFAIGLWDQLKRHVSDAEIDRSTLPFCEMCQTSSGTKCER